MPSSHVVRTFVPVKLSPGAMRRAARRPDGKPRDPREMEWLRRFCETGDATACAALVFNLPDKHEDARKKGWALARSFADHLPGLLMERRGFLEPLALATLQRVMARFGEDYVYVNKETGEETREPPENWRAQTRLINGLDAKGRPVKDIEVPVWEQVNLLDVSPQAAQAAVKAAGEILDRGGMPRGMALHGLPTTAQDDAGERDWRTLLDAMVSMAGGGSVGAQVVRRLPQVANRRDYRDYLDERYGQIKMVGGDA